MVNLITKILFTKRLEIVSRISLGLGRISLKSGVFMKKTWLIKLLHNLLI